IAPTSGDDRDLSLDSEHVGHVRSPSGSLSTAAPSRPRGPWRTVARTPFPATRARRTVPGPDERRQAVRGQAAQFLDVQWRAPHQGDYELREGRLHPPGD